MTLKSSPLSSIIYFYVCAIQLYRHRHMRIAQTSGQIEAKLASSIMTIVVSHNSH